ncbi:MAG: C25 family cysteine peptidase [Thermoanaerobaculia bacterium]
MRGAIAPGFRTLLAMGVLVVVLDGEAVAAEPRPAIKIFLSQPGIYRVTQKALVAAGWPAEEIASSRLAMRHQAAVTPIWIEDGGDGRFGAGDALLFAGDRLPGEHGYYNEHSSLNVYWLIDDPESGAAGQPGSRLQPGREMGTAAAGPESHWQRRSRQEEDRLLLRYPNAGVEDQELWYWKKLSYLDANRFEVPVDLTDLDRSVGAQGGDTAVEIAVELRGWSKPRSKPSPEFADHAVEILWDGEVIGRRQWSGTEEAEKIELRLPAAGVEAAIHQLALRVPERPALDNLPLVDVSILNWLEVVAPRTSTLAVAAPVPAAPESALAEVGKSGPPQLRLEPRPAYLGKPASITIPAGGRFDLFADGGERFTLSAPGSADRLTAIPAASASWVVPSGGFLAPRALELDRPSNLKDPGHQADFLLVSHPSLAAAMAPLVALRRSQGLTVAEVDVRDIYDEWSAGVTDPRAIRDFVDYAFHHWRAPAPRFLLLVGDASWDGKNEVSAGPSPDWAFRLSDRAEFIQNGSTPYTSGQVAASRNLIPTWGYGSAEGHAAGDNAFVAIDGDDEKPDLAVGRFPVVEPAEVVGIVAKIVGYETAPVVGDWQSRILWVTNEESYTQAASDRLALEIAPLGFTANKVYPVAVVPPTSDDQVALRSAFDKGALVVHFFGHGGRYIWRTAAPDLASQRDLFDLSDVEALASTGMLPLVLSMTCYSAPFDHPTADSIGEKLLREPGKGAVAVFAASWRNAPREEWSRGLLEELLRPGTVGEAILHMKRRVTQPDLIRQYNLRGDPAMRLALPASVASAANHGSAPAH